MKITESGAIRSASDTKKLRSKGAVSDSNFADILEAASDAQEASETSMVSDIAATTALDNMLALQEISEHDVQRKKLLQRGKNLLDSLENLRRQLLMGEIPMHTLMDLNRQLSLEKQTINDPQLLALIEDIELRAAVELAKLQMASRSTK